MTATARLSASSLGLRRVAGSEVTVERRGCDSPSIRRCAIDGEGVELDGSRDRAHEADDSLRPAQCCASRCWLCPSNSSIARKRSSPSSATSILLGQGHDLGAAAGRHRWRNACSSNVSSARTWTLPRYGGAVSRRCSTSIARASAKSSIECAAHAARSCASCATCGRSSRRSSDRSFSRCSRTSQCAAASARCPADFPTACRPCLWLHLPRYLQGAVASTR